jgi:hypothetical protein
MRDPEKTSNEDFDEAEIVGDSELDVEEFIGSMEGGGRKAAKSREPARAGWQRVDDFRDARWLREQLNDWEDWDEED